ncbi:MAG: hypothetical protein Q9175_003369 [Cornicularia normoerica]
MASIRKKMSMALGFNGETSPSTSRVNSMDVDRGSIDSGYHSMIARPKRGSQSGLSQANTFVTSGTESSPERSPRKLHKAISTTFSGAMQAISKTVRSTTSYIYPTPGEPELPSSEWAECETPEKESRRFSIMSSVRSRKQRFTPRAPDAKIKSPEPPQSPVSVTQERAPALDVEIPHPSFTPESLGSTPISRGSQLLAGVKLPAGPKNLWPGPTRLTVDQASGNGRRETLHPVSSEFNDPYVEQGGRLQHGPSFNNLASEPALESSSPETNKRYLSDDKGYFSEVESNADVSECDELAPACRKYVALGSPEARTSSPCLHTDSAASHVHLASSASPCQTSTPSCVSSSLSSGSKPSKSETFDGTVEQTPSLHPPSRSSSQHCASHEDDIDVLFPSALKSKSLCKRLPSDVYDADAESLESSMGSRVAWERHRADRERRYMEIVDMDPNTESDEEMGPDLELKRSPSKKPVHYAEKLCLGAVNIGESGSKTRYPTGALRYAVEAIERPALPVGDWAYAVEAIERPSVTTFDPLETVFQQRPMLRLIDTIDEQENLPVCEPQDLPPSRMEVPSSQPADLSPSRVELPSSPESSVADIPAAPKYTMMTMKLSDEELMTFGVGKLDTRSIRRFSSDSIDVSANSSPEQQSRRVREDAYEAGLKAGDLFVPTYLSPFSKIRSVGEDAYEASLRAAGIPMPAHLSDMGQARPAMDISYKGDHKATSLVTPIFKETSHGTYCEQLEAGSTLPEPRSRNGSPTEHSRTVSALSDDTDDSCAITTYSPSCNAPPPFPSLHVRSEPGRRIPSAIDVLVAHGDEQIRIAGPANGGISPSLPSPFDGSGDQTNEARSKLFSSKTMDGVNSPDNYAQVTWLEHHDLQSPSPGTTSSIQSPSNSNTQQETFSGTKLPSFVSPSLIASRKARRKQKKSSSGTGTVPFAGLTMNVNLEPDFSPSKSEHNKNSALGKTQRSLGESARIAGGSVQKPSLNRQSGRKGRRGRDQTSFEEFTEIVGGSVTWLDPGSQFKSSKKSPGRKRQPAATLPETPSPPQMKAPRVRGKASPSEIHESAGSAVEDSKSRFEPEFSIKHFDSTSANRGSGSTSYAGHQLLSVFQDNPSEYSHYEMNGDLQQDTDKKAVRYAHGVETNGNGSEPGKDSPRAPGQKRNGKSPPKSEKEFAVQRELKRKSDRASSRLVGKLNSEALGDNQARGDDKLHKEGRSTWRL